MKNEKISELYGKVGVIVAFSQMIEYNLAMVFSFNEILTAFDKVDSIYIYEYNDIVKKANNWYEKINNNTLGFALNKIKGINFFSSDFEKQLNHILKKRNYVVHNIFKEDIGKDEMLNNTESFFPMLEELIEKMNNINTQLCDIILMQKKEYKTIY